MSVKVFIDGSSGTTGLRIADRLAARPEIELLSISAEGRKDVNERAKVINSADLAFLCLPDAASKEVMPLLRPDVKVLDTSTAFRTDAAWDYGFPELKGQKEKIKNSDRVAVPGCYASGFISIARPLVELGLAPKDYPFSCTGISGYSGGGKKMIAEYESADRPAHSKLDAPKSYGLSLAHKHLPEMKEISGLAHTPMFVPVVCDYYCGMQVLVPLDLTVAGTTAEAVAAGLADYYKDAATVKVHALNEPLPENGLYSNAMAGTDRMELYLTVNAAGDQMMLVSLFDNLGKGSSGAAVQCMNLMLGLPETGRHIVLMSGSIGCGPMGDVAEDLDMRMADGDFATVLCGSNKQMRYALELRRLYRVEAVGFTTQVQLYMDSADVLVSKPGGISITEAGTRGVPLLLADMVGGCETRNEAFFTAHGWAASCPPDNMAASALAFLEDEQQRQAITAAQSRDFDGLAADRVAAAVLARCKK